MSKVILIIHSTLPTHYLYFFHLEYTVHYKTDDGDWKAETVGSTIDNYVIKGLRCGTRYQIYMTASNSLGTGEPSAPVFARTQGAGKLSIIKNR